MTAVPEYNAHIRRFTNMIKLIASDMDGTLLNGGLTKPSPHALELIHELTQKGVHFVAASGRQYDNLRLLFEPIRDEISYIAENGSMCMHGGKVISRGLIPDDLAYRIINEVKNNSDFQVLVSREDTCLIDNSDPEFVHHIVHEIKNTTTIVDDITAIEGPFLKIAIANMHDGPEVIQNYLKHLIGLFGSEIKVVTSGNIWIDFVVPDANKGSSLTKLMDLFGVEPSECVAFGDQYNDVEMLEAVGTSYAMSNAAPGISYHADYVTDSVEDVLEDILASLS